MHHVRVLHNGDLRPETTTPSPHWTVHVCEDGRICGEVLTRASGRMLPEGFCISNPRRFFEIPPEMKRHSLASHPHHEEVIVSLVSGGGHHECTFLMSQLAAGSSLRSALEELQEKINEITEPDAGGNSR